MKKLMFFITFFTGLLFPQSNYEAILVIEEVHWQNNNEWGAYLRVDLELNGEFQDPSTDYFYTWEQKPENGDWEVRVTGYELFYISTDGMANQKFWWRVRITGTNPQFSTLSNEVEVVKYGLITDVDVNAFKENGTSANNDVMLRIWAKYNWYDRTLGRNVFLTEDVNNVLKDSAFSLYNQKFHRWETIEPALTYYNNHAGIYVGEETNDINVYHRKYYNATFNLTSEIPSLNISIIDPWFVDTENQAYYQAPYGYRNLGLDAIPEEVMNGVYGGIFLNQGSPNWAPPYYSISIPSSIYLPQTGKTHNLYLQSWGGTDVSFQYPNSNETGVVFTDDNAVATANVKATQLSDNQNAFNNNSQRKFIRTPDLTNTLHMVYESMGHVYYETSIDNGESWKLMNDGNPLDNGGGKLPSIDYTVINTHNFIVIVFQENSGAPPNSSSIKAVVYRSRWGDLPFQYFETETIYSSLFYSYNTNPVISISSVGTATIVWEVTGDGLYHRLGGINNDGLHLIGPNTKLAGTTRFSKNPSIAVSQKTNSTEVTHLVWEENNVIKYYTFYSAPPGTIQSISNGDGYTYNSRPSVIALADGYGRVCWVGSRSNYSEENYKPSMETRTIFRGTNNNHFWAFGYAVASPNINNSDDQSYYAIVWNQNENSTFFADNTLSTIREITGVPGKNVQVSNGSTKDQMYAEVFNGQSLPYYFRTSNSMGSYYVPHKITNYAFSSGREGVIAKGYRTILFYSRRYNC